MVANFTPTRNAQCVAGGIVSTCIEVEELAGQLQSRVENGEEPLRRQSSHGRRQSDSANNDFGALLTLLLANIICD